jgi:hypothetical protein
VYEPQPTAGNWLQSIPVQGGVQAQTHDAVHVPWSLQKLRLEQSQVTPSVVVVVEVGADVLVIVVELVVDVVDVVVLGAGVVVGGATQLPPRQVPCPPPGKGHGTSDVAAVAQIPPWQDTSWQTRAGGQSAAVPQRQTWRPASSRPHQWEQQSACSRQSSPGVRQPAPAASPRPAAACSARREVATALARRSKRVGSMIIPR